MSTTTATRGRKAAYDPQRQWGLKPEPAQGTGSTYVLSGHIISSSGSDSRSLFVAENIGREGQAKAQSKIKRADEDRELKRLLERDKEGMMAVIKAREVAVEMEEVKGKGKERAKDGKKSAGAHSEKGKPAKNKNAAQDNSQDTAATTHKSYSAAVIRSLGFDPSIKPGQQRVDDSAVQKKV
jgi:minichromosome maintenance protein 10